MFTGIVGEMGTIEAISATPDGARLRLAAPATAPGCAVGDSVAIDGCCLTAVEVDGGALAFDAVAETLARTTLGELRRRRPGERRARAAAGRPPRRPLVQGHVDGVGRVTRGRARRRRRPRHVRGAAEASPATSIEKGSVAVDGVSLTVAGARRRRLRGRAHPAHLRVTTLGRARRRGAA